MNIPEVGCHHLIDLGLLPDLCQSVIRQLSRNPDPFGRDRCRRVAVVVSWALFATGIGSSRGIAVGVGA